MRCAQQRNTTTRSTHVNSILKRSYVHTLFVNGIIEEMENNEVKSRPSFLVSAVSQVGEESRIEEIRAWTMISGRKA